MPYRRLNKSGKRPPSKEITGTRYFLGSEQRSVLRQLGSHKEIYDIVSLKRPYMAFHCWVPDCFLCIWLLLEKTVIMMTYATTSWQDYTGLKILIFFLRQGSDSVFNRFLRVKRESGGKSCSSWQVFKQMEVEIPENSVFSHFWKIPPWNPRWRTTFDTGFVFSVKIIMNTMLLPSRTTFADQSYYRNYKSPSTPRKNFLWWKKIFLIQTNLCIARKSKKIFFDLKNKIR